MGEMIVLFIEGIHVFAHACGWKSALAIFVILCGIIFLGVTFS